ncbi:HAD-IIB family hydrolase [Microbacterium sp. KSW4-11]|uniref:HAD-IIB family hydrolase n=1 Tax=Microbacterium gawkjiense TaxID=3067309 RepID=A0ABU3G7E9_9MICO|nr:HAD-IIB family hydrolase [Microbacterium sp. KSW4-11]MDT3315739.1 HAD-IIB family hydrolase [Microbacterium sp. KSW4-11]
MSPEGAPATGEVRAFSPDDAAEVVDEIATDAAEPPRERLLIALDVDGTILLEDESYSPGVVDAIADAQRAGHEVMLATGRSWEGTRHILEGLALTPEYVVCSNGAVILRRTGPAGTREYERFHTEQFDASEVLTLLRDHLPSARYMVELPDGRRLYTDDMDEWNVSRADRVPFEDLSAQPVSRVVVVSEEGTDQDFVDLVSRIGLNEVSYAVGWSAWLDIAPQGVDKATGLEKVREWLGIDPAHVVVIGDGRNDIGMFRWARANGGRAIAMGQGPDEVTSEASELTASVTEGGVTAVLKAL